MRKRNLYIDRFHSRICPKFAAIASTSSTTPQWLEAFERLSSEPTDVERLAICQAIRDDGCLSPEEGFYLVASHAEQFGCGRDDAELSEMRRELKAVAATRKPTTSAPWTSDAEPIESREPRQQLDVCRQESRLLDTLIAAGEYDIAALFVKDRDEYERLWELGHELFHGVPACSSEGAETWLDELVHRISELATWEDPTDSLVLRAHLESDFWVIFVHPEPIEIVDGADDGVDILPEFRLDLLGLIGLFEETYEVYWDAATMQFPGWPGIMIEGLYQGQHIFLCMKVHPSRDKVRPFRVSRVKVPR